MIQQVVKPGKSVVWVEWNARAYPRQRDMLRELGLTPLGTVAEAARRINAAFAERRAREVQK